MARSFLLVEDDRHKRDRISGCLGRWGNDSAIVSASSVQEAVTRLHLGPFRAVLLDMALPSHSPKRGAGAATSLLSGGMEILMELAYLGRSDPIIIITQYQEIEIEGGLVPLVEAKECIRSRCKANLVGIIYFEFDTPEWENLLVDSLKVL